MGYILNGLLGLLLRSYSGYYQLSRIILGLLGLFGGGSYISILVYYSMPNMPNLPNLMVDGI